MIQDSREIVAEDIEDRLLGLVESLRLTTERNGVPTQ